ncbi:MAG: hypothetical protein ACRCWJ_18175 [Casimicrobium sp.]
MKSLMQILSDQSKQLESETELSEEEKSTYALAFAHGLREGAMHTLEIMQPINAPFKQPALEQMKADVIRIGELITDCTMTPA